MAAPTKLHLLLDAAYDEHRGYEYRYFQSYKMEGNWHVLEDAHGHWQIGVIEDKITGELTWRRCTREFVPWVEVPPPD